MIGISKIQAELNEKFERIYAVLLEIRDELRSARSQVTPPPGS